VESGDPESFLAPVSSAGVAAPSVVAFASEPSVSEPLTALVGSIREMFVSEMFGPEPFVDVSAASAVTPVPLLASVWFADSESLATPFSVAASPVVAARPSAPSAVSFLPAFGSPVSLFVPSSHCPDPLLVSLAAASALVSGDVVSFAVAFAAWVASAVPLAGAERVVAHEVDVHRRHVGFSVVRHAIGHRYLDALRGVRPDRERPGAHRPGADGLLVPLSA